MIPLTRLLIKTVHSHDELDFDAPLLQAGLGGCPWRVAVASILLNRTRRAQVQPILQELLRRWPTPMELAKADRASLADLIRPLGFQHERSRRLVRFTAVFLEDTWDDLLELPGVGPYVNDAVGLVCFGCTAIVSGDPALVPYARKLDLARVELGGSD